MNYWHWMKYFILTKLRRSIKGNLPRDKSQDYEERVYCSICGKPFQAVRPGKWQPECSCYEGIVDE